MNVVVQLQHCTGNGSVSAAGMVQQTIHGERYHQQAIAHAFVAKNLMWMIGLHCEETKIADLGKQKSEEKAVIELLYIYYRISYD